MPGVPGTPGASGGGSFSPGEWLLLMGAVALGLMLCFVVAFVGFGCFWSVNHPAMVAVPLAGPKGGDGPPGPQGPPGASAAPPPSVFQKFRGSGGDSYQIGMIAAVRDAKDARREASERSAQKAAQSDGDLTAGKSNSAVNFQTRGRSDSGMAR